MLLEEINNLEMNKLLNSQNPLNNQVYDTNQVHSGGTLSLIILFLLGAFVLPKGQIPVWLSWGHQISLLLYGFNALKRNGLGLQPSWGSPFSSMFCCT
ncbi:hypothetical protein LWI29_014457 [Acer saccharum]|nr:hypothetical protein LWI29_014457 [Acer saccharum]